MSVEKILSERKNTHGSYAETAHISQRLKTIVGTSKNANSLSPDQLETLEMICHKMARILAGDPEFADHWDDIAGYATLSANEVRARIAKATRKNPIPSEMVQVVGPDTMEFKK